MYIDLCHKKCQKQESLMKRELNRHSMGSGPLAPQPGVGLLCSLAVVAIVILQLLSRLDVPGSYQTEAGALGEGDHLRDHIGLFAAVVQQTPHPSTFLCGINTIAITRHRYDTVTPEEQVQVHNEHSNGAHLDHVTVRTLCNHATTGHSFGLLTTKCCFI